MLVKEVDYAYGIIFAVLKCEWSDCASPITHSSGRRLLKLIASQFQRKITDFLAKLSKEVNA